MNHFVFYQVGSRAVEPSRLLKVLRVKGKVGGSVITSVAEQ